MSRPPAALKITCTGITISMHIIINTKTRTSPSTERGIHMGVLLRWYAYPVSWFDVNKMLSTTTWVGHLSMIHPSRKYVQPEGRDERDAPRHIRQGQDILGRPSYCESHETSFHVSPTIFHLYHISFQSCPRPRASHNAVTEDLDFVCCKDSKYKDPWPDA